MIIKSMNFVYDREEKRFTYPLYELDTDRSVVVCTDPESSTRKEIFFHTDYVRYHLKYVSENDIGRLKTLVNNGDIINYLEDFEDKCFDIADRQTEKWKEQDKEYRTAVLNGDIVHAAGLANNLGERAREIVFDTMVYR